MKQRAQTWGGGYLGGTDEKLVFVGVWSSEAHL